ncbi:MAG: flavin reductase family protein [Candidatus Micrarchaeia archaeon]|jgi:flavin reductase (DIM6/NTAB) family NADH-FMN oxidoreductase RutF
MFKDLFYPRQAVLVTAASSEKANVTAVEWITPIGEKPPLVALSLHNTSLTLELLSTSMEFVVAIPSEKLRDAVLLCGATSGKFIDKFSEANLTQVKAKRVSAPLIMEAAANIECRVLNYTSAGDHTLVVGEVVEVTLSKDNREFPPLMFGAAERKAGWQERPPERALESAPEKQQGNAQEKAGKAEEKA